MNYLAHAWLSGNHPGVLVGNLISDFVKGRTRFNYPEEVQLGISLHRTIDQITDQHPATREAKEFFRPAYRLYSGAFVDVVYDHFLASDPAFFPEEGNLFQFSQHTFQHLKAYQGPLPDQFSYLLPYMIRQNWLYHYRFTRGIEESFGGLVRRTVHLTDRSAAITLFHQHYPQLNACYQAFIPDMVHTVTTWFQEHLPEHPTDHFNPS